MKYIGTYSNDADIATKAKVDAKQDKVLVDGILQGDGAGTISAAETQEVELVTLTKADVGLDNVDNTSDANKPISTATQTALNGKQATITGGATTITTSNLTANRALVSNANGKVAVSDVTSTELGYLDGVTSNIQTQLDSKLSTAPVTSVNSKTGAVELTASDVGAQPTITANGFLKGDGNGNITADKPVFTVTITPTEADSSTGTADKTPGEILAAYNAGYAVQALCKVPDTTMPVTLSLNTIADAQYFIVILFSVSVYGDVCRGWTIAHVDATENWQIAESNMVQDTLTINGHTLDTDITLNAADVNAVGLTGDQTIAGKKTFSDKATFDGEVNFSNSTAFNFGTTFGGGIIVNGGSQFTGQQGFDDGMVVGGSTQYEENSTVDFTNATVSGLKGLLPTVTASDNGKFLRVVDGVWAAATVENANGVSF